MEEKTEILNETISEEMAADNLNSDVPETGIETEPAAAKKEGARLWGSGVVTKKFLTIALAVTILINAGVTAGVVMLSSKNSSDSRGNMRRGNSEMFSDDKPGGNGHMSPPQDKQNDQNNQNNDQGTTESDESQGTQS